MDETEGPGSASDDRLVQAALQQGYVRPEQVKEALQEQAREVAAGRSKPRALENILVAKGWLKVEHLTALRAPKDVPRYVPKGEIARGGMGAILRIGDTGLRRDVAMKVMLDGSDEESRARFEEEAQVTGQLEHPNIVPVHEFGTDAESRPYFTMKLVQGRSLAEILRQVREQKAPEFSLHRLLTIFTNVCNGIAFAHSKGVVHRDLKPANVMVGDYGEVLVMDWGLAKIGAARASGTGHPAAASSRQEQADGRTMDGAVMGTPHYMPPEQARGDIAAIDERSDVYSLGAILYEILVLKPPVEGPTLQALLRNVAEGKIAPPERRAPERNVPLELSAVALKALARMPGDRYPNVEALRRDVELFLEGRAVSAKADSAWESLLKLVRRNRGASVAVAVAAAAVTVTAGLGYHSNLQERRKVERSLADLQAEQARRADRERTAAPALVQKAIREAEEGRLQAAMDDVALAVRFAPDSREAQLLKADLHIVLKEFLEAGRIFENLSGADDEAVRLASLCRDAATSLTPELSTSFATHFSRRKLYPLAEQFLHSREQALALARKRIEAAWPGQGQSVTLLPDGTFAFRMAFGDVRDLSPLKGIPISDLVIAKNPIEHLAPLEGMPLRKLNLLGTRVVDLSPLRGMRLTHLEARNTGTQVLSPLQGMPLVQLSLDGSPVSDLSPLQGAPLQELSIRSLPNVVDFSTLKGMPLRVLDLWDCRKFSDASILAGAPLESLNLSRTAVRNLAPLKGAPLHTLDLDLTAVSDLSPLAGMRIENLYASFSAITTLDPLAGMPLRNLHLRSCPSLRAFSGMRGLPLVALVLDHTSVSDADLALLRDNSTLKSLSVLWCKGVTRVPAFPSAPLGDLYLGNSGIRDLRPLSAYAIDKLGTTPENFRDGLPDPESMKSLRTVYLGDNQLNPMQPQEFFRRYRTAK
jgi:Leucine-rich repeat (LRR) protein